MHQECFSAFVRFKITQDKTIFPKGKIVSLETVTFSGVVLAMLAESLQLQVRGGSSTREVQS